MNVFILTIVILYAGHGAAVDHIEFSSQENCNNALKKISDDIKSIGFFSPSFSIICTEK